ncbi:MAG: STAS domain-containing protein [Planctomycetaceae bacterium]|nr:STAS domain-containing protein [Planctomycetaceae bacterium]
MWKSEITEESGVVMVTLGAEFQVIDQTVIGLCRKLWKELEDKNAYRVVLDLGYTNYMDSEFLGMLFEIREHVIGRPSGRIGICSLLPHPREVFALTKLDTLFDIFETSEKAKTAYAHAAEPEFEYSLAMC